ncbi:hypothetical protein K9M18_05820, partial [Candidatus Woesearchaeota archaeon]|nr:hypothetical protein [Candidatus Woesearchaeota archaeon]
MENVFEPMNFDGEVFEPMNFDGDSSDSVYFDGEEYSNFINFQVLKKNVGKVVTAPFRVAGAIASIVRKEPSVKINATVVPAIKQSIITDANKKPFVVTPLNNKLLPLGTLIFPIKNKDVVISEPISKNDIKPMNLKEISVEVSKNIGSIVPKPSVLTPSQISVVTETIVKDNNNKPFLITPISGVKPNGFTEDFIKPNVVISINKEDLPKPINAKNEEGKAIEVATAIKEDIVKPKEEVVPTISAESTPNAP